ncbi:protein kinase [Planotetraspora sp. A-T 1434]|uniref:serine/threonine-protein kinase n=1 Tax=Planotetraspora sp. A-T 1434 TaxID=2979219 RepID=UPI0021BECF48|nr:serine/threonine protein kinase [Planotetraspora sp. A-T 1434]MCT9930277.1 protein kinase [Planotetraspora sp. A-T 1434]
MDEAGGPLVPGYEVLGILGQGGFGIVYRARQLAVGREVALKIDNRVLVSDRDRRRFMREVTSAGALSGHPHVADVYDAGVLSDGRPYMVLELCPGGSLADRLKRHGPLSVREVRDIGIKIADALAAAHATGVLHRDVKPANILINSYGLVALSDFGLATMPAQGGTAQGEVSVTRESLTPAYAPPEAFDLSEPTAAGDVYALAATLYALLYGRPPRFPESGVVNIAVIMALHRRPIPDIPGVPSALTDVLRHGMASDPGQRIPTAAGLRDALAALDIDGSARPGHPAAVPDPRSLGSPLSWGADTSGGAAPEQWRPSGPDGPGAAPPRYAVTSPGGRHGAAAVPDVRRAMTEPNALAGPGHPAPPAHLPPPSHLSAPGHLTPPHHLAPHNHLAPSGRLVASAPPGGLGTGRSGVTTRPAGASRHSFAFAAVAAVFALLLTAGIVVIARGDGDPRTTPSAEPTGTAQSRTSQGRTSQGRTAAPDVTAAAGRLGVPVRTDGCPAASVAGAGAACVAKPECWAGPVSIGGDVTARPLPCAGAHTWETFAIAPLPDDLTTSDEYAVSRHPTVAGLCTMAVLLKSRTGAARTVSPDRWDVTVLPPSAARFAAGSRAYRCLGHVAGKDTTGSAFGAAGPG